MAQAILTVLILIVVVAYAVFFAFWNPTAVRVVGFQGFGQQAWTDMYLWMLPLIGLAIGAVVMALAMWTPWTSLKRNLAAARERLAAEQTRSRELAARLKAVRERSSGAGAAQPAGAGAAQRGELPEDA
ncbi:MAG: hypothetical protein AB7Y46_20590 [Armatimonadota bacterium]